MLALPGLVGCFLLLLVCASCRRPGVRLFTVITLSNRQRTLTPLGSTLYLVVWVFCVAVITLSLLFPNAFMHHVA
ncbi:hypothetical protein P9239_16630 [Caballeronia sp. LZ062]|uniref:hypothetical protein n=1 Tax=unclassified Caballeronia TaxID=2646786 RepID=UPI00285D452B|nr:MULTISPECIES: hypothetical protein [unclassified Caballeronia]MDR5853496.1 hypothetical protein [Caballeronia sp. LZ050]MDR5871970.1 hypothetical protein [Caballeronia sp. LZ062]